MRAFDEIISRSENQAVLRRLAANPIRRENAVSVSTSRTNPNESNYDVKRTVSYQNAENMLKEARKYSKRSDNTVIMRRIDESFNDAMDRAMRASTMRNGNINATAAIEIMKLRSRYNKIVRRG